MSPKEKFLLGGAGALIPILLTVAVADAAKIGEYLNGEFYSLAGYFVKAVALFLVGAIYVYVDKTVTTQRKAIEIGLAAPALISALISASNVNLERTEEEQNAMSLEIVSSAYAQDHSGDNGSDRPSPLQQFIKGLLGR